MSETFQISKNDVSKLQSFLDSIDETLNQRYEQQKQQFARDFKFDIENEQVIEDQHSQSQQEQQNQQHFERSDSASPTCNSELPRVRWSLIAKKKDGQIEEVNLSPRKSEPLNELSSNVSNSVRQPPMLQKRKKEFAVPNNDRVSALTRASTNFTAGRSSIFEMLTDRSRQSSLRQSIVNEFTRGISTNYDAPRRSSINSEFLNTPSSRLIRSQMSHFDFNQDQQRILENVNEDSSSKETEDIEEEKQPQQPLNSDRQNQHKDSFQDQDSSPRDYYNNQNFESQGHHTNFGSSQSFNRSLNLETSRSERKQSHPIESEEQFEEVWNRQQERLNFHSQRRGPTFQHQAQPFAREEDEPSDEVDDEVDDNEEIFRPHRVRIQPQIPNLEQLQRQNDQLQLQIQHQQQSQIQQQASNFNQNTIIGGNTNNSQRAFNLQHSGQSNREQEQKDRHKNK